MKEHHLDLIKLLKILDTEIWANNMKHRTVLVEILCVIFKFYLFIFLFVLFE